MDIDKIQFGELSSARNIDKSFEDLDVNNDGKINEQDENLATNIEIKNAISQILSSDVDEEPELDENADFDIDNISPRPMGEGQSEGATPQADTAQIATLSLQVQQLQKEQEELQDKLEDKQKEQQKIEKQILAKQEEYENLAKELENSQEKDPNKVALAEQLASEIKTLTTDFENLKSEITEIQGKSKNNSTQLQMLTTQIQSLQSQTTQAVSQTNAVNDVNAIGEVSNATQVNKLTSSNGANSTQKIELKSLNEYVDIARAKFNSIIEQCGSVAKAKQYIDNNMIDFIDMDGDGRVTLIDRLVLDEVRTNSNSKEHKDEWSKYNYLDYNQMFSSIQSAIRSAATDTLLNLEDVENFYELFSQKSRANNDPNLAAGFIIKQFNVTQIVQSENWEERLQNINYPQFHTQLNYDPVGSKDWETGVWMKKQSEINKLRSAAEFMQKNPDKAQYAGVAAQYKNLMKVYDSADWNKLADDDLKLRQEWYDEEIKNKGTKYKACEELIDTAKKNNALAKDWSVEELLYSSIFSGYQSAAERQASFFENNCCFSYNLIDFNGDGTINAKDIEAFSTEVDLDCDGTVSESERKFLTNIKEKFTQTIYKRQICNGTHNVTSIDALITTLETFDVDSTSQGMSQRGVDDKKTQVKGIVGERNLLYRSADNPMTYEEGLDFCADWPHVVGPMMSYLTGGNLHFSVKGYMDGTSIGLNALEDIHTFGELIDAIPIVANAAKPTNTYLHYVQSADLTKAELEEILNKINNASASVQSQLAEVKSVVEQRIASM